MRELSWLQSATHSKRLPTMSTAPQLEAQAARAPVDSTAPVSMLHEVASSGVPAAAACHSSFRSSRLPTFRQACSAWNQVMFAEGVTPGADTAKIGWAAVAEQSLPVSEHG